MLLALAARPLLRPCREAAGLDHSVGAAVQGANLFERMVLALVRLAQGPSGQDSNGQALPQSPDEQAIRMSVSTRSSALDAC